MFINLNRTGSAAGAGAAPPRTSTQRPHRETRADTAEEAADVIDGRTGGEAKLDRECAGGTLSPTLQPPGWTRIPGAAAKARSHQNNRYPMN